MALAITGQAFEVERNVTVSVGENFEVGRYTLNYQGLAQKTEEHLNLVYANVTVSKGGETIATMKPAKSFTSQQE